VGKFRGFVRTMIKLYFNYIKWWLLGVLAALAVVMLFKLPLGDAVGAVAVGLAIIFLLRTAADGRNLND
jgi:hypothetical protein